MEKLSLREILKNLILLNKKLIECFKEEKKAVGDLNYAALKEITGREMMIGSHIQEWESKRKEYLSLFSQKFQLQKENIHIQDVLEKVDPVLRNELAPLANELKQILNEIVRLRNLNNRLIEKTIHFNERNIQLFMSFGKKNLTYSQDGNLQKSDQSLLNSVV